MKNLKYYEIVKISVRIYMEQEAGLSIASSSCTTFIQNFITDLNIIVMCIRKKVRNNFFLHVSYEFKHTRVDVVPFLILED